MFGGAYGDARIAKVAPQTPPSGPGITLSSIPSETGRTINRIMQKVISEEINQAEMFSVQLDTTQKESNVLSATKIDIKTWIGSLTDGAVNMQDDQHHSSTYRNKFIRKKMNVLMNQFVDYYKSITSGDTVLKSQFDKSSAYAHVNQAYRFLIETQASVVVPKAARTKSAARATSLRNEGNAAFNRSQNAEARHFYTNSISVAPPDSEELALAFANRAAVLLRLGRFEECYLDLNRALRGNYPNEMKSKLQNRKKRCVAQMDERNRLNAIALKEIQKLQRPSTPFGAVLFPLLKLYLKERKLDDSNNEPTNVHFSCPTVELGNKPLPGFSSKVKLVYNEGWGRHVVAAQDIAPGEIVGSEKAFVSLIPDHHDQLRFSICSFCFVRCYALIPCQGCSLVLYCGDRCQAQAYELYHRIECEVIQLSEGARDRMDTISLRTMLIGTEQGKQLKNLMQNERFRYLFGDGPRRVNRKYKREYFALCHLEVGYDRQPKLHTGLAIPLRAACTIRLLKQTSFFSYAEDVNHDETVELTEAEVFAGNLLVNHYLLCWNNPFPIKQYECNLINGYMQDQELGAGLFCFFGIIGHSCDPNLSVFYYGDRQILTAIRPIAAGDQLYITYAGRYYLTPKENRKKQMRHFGIECQCRACEFNWPDYANLPNSDSKNLSKEIKLLVKRFYALNMNARSTSLCGPAAIGAGSSKNWLQFIYDCNTIFATVERPWKEGVDCEREIENVFKTKGNCYLSNVSEFLKANTLTYSTRRH